MAFGKKWEGRAGWERIAPFRESLRVKAFACWYRFRAVVGLCSIASNYTDNSPRGPRSLQEFFGKRERPENLLLLAFRPSVNLLGDSDGRGDSNNNFNILN